MEASSTDSSGGGKRKYKENALTAKAETGSLRIKILRKEGDPLGPPGTSGVQVGGRRGKANAPAPGSPESPPKPRPNRKHVPIFYQQKHRPRHPSSSTDGASASSASSTTGSVSQAVEALAAASTSSTTSSYGSLLSGLQLHSNSSSSTGDVLLPPPRPNPLFSRSDSDGLSTLGDLLRPHFPSASFPLGGSTGASSTNFPLGGSTASASAALHQLATSSTAYRSALEALSAATVQSGTTASTEQSTSSTLSHSAAEAAAPTAAASSADQNEYRFNPLSALQSAIDHAQHLSQKLAASVPSSAEHSQSPTSSSVAPAARDHSIQNLLDDSGDDEQDEQQPSLFTLPPLNPPQLALQNSLAGGGIELFAGSDQRDKRLRHDFELLHKAISKSAASSPTKDTPFSTASGDAVAEDDEEEEGLGPPPSAPPPFRIENSLMGGGIETQPTIANVNTHNFDWKFHEANKRLNASKGGAKSRPAKDEGGDAKSSREGNKQEVGHAII